MSFYLNLPHIYFSWLMHIEKTRSKALTGNLFLYPNSSMLFCALILLSKPRQLVTLNTTLNCLSAHYHHCQLLLSVVMKVWSILFRICDTYSNNLFHLLFQNTYLSLFAYIKWCEFNLREIIHLGKWYNSQRKIMLLVLTDLFKSRVGI